MEQALKVALIESFLAQQQLPVREAEWFLRYLLGQPQALSNLHVVEHALAADRGILVQTAAGDTAFAMKRADLLLTIPDQIFHEVNAHQDQAYFLELDFPQRQLDLDYLTVLEDNPYYRWADHPDPEVSERLATYWTMRQQQALIAAIDQALAQDDQISFQRLSQQYQELKKQRQAKH
jgi:uncharacterized protein YpiB (UPF0302 family)